MLVFNRQLQTHCDVDVPPQALVVRNDVAASLRKMEAPDDEGLRAIQNAMNVPLGAPVIGDAAQANDDPVMVHRVRGVGRRDENVAVDTRHGTVRGHESIAVAMEAESSGDVLGIGAGQAVVAALELDDAAFGDQVFEPLRQLAVLLSAHAELPGQVLEAGAAAGLLPDMAQQSPGVNGSA